jgi:hypothetical protein
VAVRFAIVDPHSVASELRFQWDSATTTIAPQCEILLQLVADACEGLLNRSPQVNPATDAATEELCAGPVPTSSGRVRTSGSDRGIEQGGGQLLLMK